MRALKSSGKGPIDPTVSVDITQGGAFTYTMYGHISSPGRFNLQDPDLRLLDALAMAGGPPLSTDKIYVVRQVHLADEFKPHYEISGDTSGGAAIAAPSFAGSCAAHRTAMPTAR